MYDIELIEHILDQIYTSAHTIMERFEPVETVEYFTGSPRGMEKLDSICMQLIAIGESLKKLDKITNRALLIKYSAVEWKKAMGLRDIITHHYFDVNAEAIFNVCQEKVPELAEAIALIRRELRKPPLPS